MFFVIFWTALVRYTWLSNSSRFFFRQSVLSDAFGLNGRHHWQLRCGAGGCRREATWIKFMFQTFPNQLYIGGIWKIRLEDRINAVNPKIKIYIPIVVSIHHFQWYWGGFRMVYSWYRRRDTSKLRQKDFFYTFEPYICTSSICFASWFLSSVNIEHPYCLWGGVS